MYLYIYSFSIFNLFFHEIRTIPITASSTVVANTLVVIVVSNFPTFKALEIARGDYDMLLSVSWLCIHNTIMVIYINYTILKFILINVACVEKETKI